MKKNKNFEGVGEKVKEKEKEKEIKYVDEKEQKY